MGYYNIMKAYNLKSRIYSCTVSEFLKYIQYNEFNFYIEPVFHQLVSECLFKKYSIEKIVLIGNSIQNVMYGESIVETILYIVNNYIITSVMFPEINGKRLSELSFEYQRYFNECNLDIIHFYGDDDCIEYLEKLSGC